MWTLGVVVTDQWSGTHSARCNYLQQGDTSSGGCYPCPCRIAVGCEIHLGCHLAQGCMMGYKQSGCTRRVLTFQSHLTWKWTQAGTRVILLVPPLQTKIVHLKEKIESPFTSTLHVLVATESLSLVVHLK